MNNARRSSQYKLQILALDNLKKSLLIQSMNYIHLYTVTVTCTEIFLTDSTSLSKEKL